MNKLYALKDSFLRKELTKQEYIEAMYESHTYIFDIQEFLGVGISEIIISNDSIVFTCRNSQVKLFCPQGDKRSIPLEILNFGDHESEELNMQIQLIKNGDIILDIGGNIGWYALHIAKQYPQSIIHTFEPVPWTFDQLQKNIQLNNLNNIFAHNFGFSNKIGEFDIFFDPSISGNASLVNVADKDNIQIHKCKIDTLDRYLEENKVAKLDFIKCDVEGAELFVFEGGVNSLEKYKPIIFTEMLRKWSAKFNYHPNDIINLLNKLNYIPYTLNNNKLQKFNQVGESTVETNYFFLHREKHITVIEQFAE